MRTRLSRWTSTLGLMYVIPFFVVTRLAAHVAGIRFYAENLPHQWHFLPLELLKTDLLRSVFSLHSQPPLFNLFLGTGLKLFADPTIFFQCAFLCLSASLLSMMFALLSTLGLPRWVSYLLISLFGLNPSLLFYENYLFYPLWEAVFLTGTALALVKYSASGFRRTSHVALMSTFVAALIFSRASFHPIWAVGIVALVLFSTRRVGLPLPRSHLAVLLTPLLLSLLWMGKNLWLVDKFAMSSALGMGVIKNALLNVPHSQVLDLRKRGAISSLALKAPFLPPSAYRDVIAESPPKGYPALDRETRRNGLANPNHRDYVAISQGMARDALTLAMHRPDAYLESVMDGAFIFFQPSDEIAAPEIHMESVSWLTQAYRGCLFHGGPFSLFRLAFLWMLVIALRPMTDFARCKRRTEPRTFLLVFSVYTVLYLTVVCSLLEVGENNRVRFGLNPLLFCMFVALALDFASRARALTVLRRVSIS